MNLPAATVGAMWVAWLATTCLMAADPPKTPPEPPQVVRMLQGGFAVQEVPVKLSNLNSLRFAPDGSLTALAYDGRIWSLRDSDADGLEDEARIFWDRPTLSVPVGMAWSRQGLVVSSKGKVSVIQDHDGDGKGDSETVIASGWPATDVGSGGVDATSAALDADGNVYFGLLVADYSNAYRLRPRSSLKPEEEAWLRARGIDPRRGEGEVSIYDINSPRGTIQRWTHATGSLETLATGIRVPYALAFNRAGDLFNTDQEGETWLPGGNPLDELNHIVRSRNYGFPPRNEKWLPGLESEAPVVGFGPQHQSACGMVFNEPQPASVRPQEEPLRPSGALGPFVPAGPGQRLFGPSFWEGSLFVAGESRAKIWRVTLQKQNNGRYSGTHETIARLSMLTTDLAISPKGDLYVSCHSGPPDWGTGPQGEGKLFRIRRISDTAPVLKEIKAIGLEEVRLSFDRPLHFTVTNFATRGWIEFGQHVRAGDRWEVLKPPYKTVQDQDATPRGRLNIRRARLVEDASQMVLTVDPQGLAGYYSVVIPGIRGAVGDASTFELESDYELVPEKASWVVTPPKSLSHATASSPVLEKADWETGRGLFFSEKLQCSKCHRVRGEGGTAGPDLSNLIHRNPEAILRDILQPSATLHPDYVTFTAETEGDAVHTGFVRSQDADSLRLADVDGKLTEVPRATLKSLRPSPVSLMPEGLLDGLSEARRMDLLTFLLNAPPQRDRSELRGILGERADEPNPRALKLVLTASKRDHSPGQHDYPAWQKRWAAMLGRLPGVQVEQAWEWPSKARFDSADAVIFYFWCHDWSKERLAQLDSFQARGGGVALFHAAVIADKDPETLAERMGLAAQPGRTGYLHCAHDILIPTPDAHPITRGLPRRVHFLDEPYWPMIGDVSQVKVLASVEREGKKHPMIWTFERNQGRVFGCILGHYTWTLEDPLFQVLALRGIAWAAQRPETRLEALLR
ncbi:MAG: hypothetical protein FJ405_07500 [Verrucomicrobia bacterium]|nr:hypothetical protein [Verrucomicrobiota bacterium]